MRCFSAHLSPVGENGSFHHGTELRNPDFLCLEQRCLYFLASEIMFELISVLSRVSCIFLLVPVSLGSLGPYLLSEIESSGII